MKKSSLLISAIALFVTIGSASAQNLSPSAFMEVLGDANAFAELCPGLKINDAAMQKAARENHIGSAILNDMRNQEKFLSMYKMTVQTAAGYTDKAAFCDTGLQMHGKDSPNIPDLLVKK